MHINYVKEVTGNNMGRVGLVMLTLLLVVAVMGNIIAPYAPGDYAAEAFVKPSGEHWLGTNDVGQDIFSRLLAGAKTSLTVALGVSLLATTIALLMGTTAAVLGGPWDRMAMRTVDIFLVMPAMIIVILVAVYIQPGTIQLIIILGLLQWPASTRIIRSQTLTLKEREHIWAARAAGANWLYVTGKHIIPDLGPILTAGAIQGARRAVFMEAGLSFLGMTDPTVVSWGKMIYHSLQFVYLDVWVWWLLPAGLCLSFTVMALSFVGFALESALDPRLRRNGNA
ncbi:peptide/nickel transport system permease protein [Desulfitispora alkaliphila]|uniref:ABC transporter permease n=1 Tax=Desulfitispora alkaliphila TaxID=622674 RepID=UPI003D1F77B8